MKRILCIIAILLINGLCCFADTSGLGIEAIRKDGLTNISAPLQIRSIQLNSPADKAKIPLNWYIICINGKYTKDLTDYSSLELLNNSSIVEITVSPLPTIYNEKAITLKLSNENGFKNIVKQVPKTKGIGLSIYKYDLDLIMPLIITEVENGSPASIAGIRKNSLILKINNKSTNNLSLTESKKLLNNKQLELEIADLQGNNSKIYKLKSQDYYANEIKNVKKRWVLGKAIVAFTKYNSEEKLLSEYFSTFNPNYTGTMNMSNKEIHEADVQKLKEPYLKYKSNKNDMAFNKYLYDGINTYVKQYQELNEQEIKSVKNILVSYDKINSSASEKQVLDYVATAKISNRDYFLNKIATRKNDINDWNTMAKEIKDYSVAYETRQKNSTPKVTTPYFIDNTDFREILWGWQNAKVPQKNGIYVISSGTGAYILQSVNGGLLVTAQPTRLSVNPRIIYILSKRQYADNDWIKDNLFMVFDGYYSYKNALGIVNKIYKFKEIPQKEYWNRIRPQKYYFINF